MFRKAVNSMVDILAELKKLVAGAEQPVVEQPQPQVDIDALAAAIVKLMPNQPEQSVKQAEKPAEVTMPVVPRQPDAAVVVNGNQQNRAAEAIQSANDVLSMSHAEIIERWNSGEIQRLMPNWKLDE